MPTSPSTDLAPVPASTSAVLPITAPDASANTPNLHSAPTPPTQLRYRWRSGDCLATYGISANKWKAHSSSADFAAAFQAIVDDRNITNDARAARVEEFLLE
jgi:hypothetical protein